jgi:hypothetical protein
MRRRVVALASLTVVLLLPRPALAWWDFIEQFSGPRSFQGPDIQLRLFCVVQTANAETGSEIRTPGPAGMLLSVCPTRKDERTKLAFDLGVRFMWSGEYTDDVNPDFGNGEKIYFSTIEPAVVFPVVVKGAFRIDYGFGAGAYWFSSEGFESFRGLFIEPVRANVHVPLSRGYAFIFSIGALVFPAGFAPTAFAGNSAHNSRIATEVVPIYAVALDLTPAVQAWTAKLGLRQ